jgi:hypothetical protein
VLHVTALYRGIRGREGGIIEMEYNCNRNTFLKLDDFEIIDLLNSITGFDLCSISYDWRESDRYVLKCRGRNGDVIVRWVLGGRV